MFGYIGALPTNSNASNTGIFSLNDIALLKLESDFSPSAFDCDFVIAGGGGGAPNGQRTGGGGGAGVLASTGQNGGLATLDSALRLSTGVNYTATIGAGGSYVGQASNFHTKTAFGGGSGSSGGTWVGSGATGGGSASQFTYAIRGLSGTNYVQSALRLLALGSESKQGFHGNKTGYESYSHGGGGGGAGAGGGTTGDGSYGVYSTILNSTEASTLGVGHWTSNALYFGGGGAGGRNSDGYRHPGGRGGGGRGANNSGGNLTGTVNTGGGGGGSGYNHGGKAGGSGAIVLKYPDTFTITASAGLTIATDNTRGDGFKRTAIKSGTGTVSFS